MCNHTYMYMNIYTYTQESSLVSSPRAHLSISSSIYLHLYLHLLSISLPISAYTCANMHARSKRTSGNHHAGGKCHVAAIDVMAAHCSHVVWVEKMRGKQRGEKQQQAEGRGKQRGAEGSRGKQRESESSAGKDGEAEGSTGRQKKAEGSTEEHREAEGSTEEQTAASLSFFYFPSLCFLSLCFPLLPPAALCSPSASLCPRLLTFASLGSSLLTSVSLCLPLLPSAALCFSLLPLTALLRPACFKYPLYCASWQQCERSMRKQRQAEKSGGKLRKATRWSSGKHRNNATYTPDAQTEPKPAQTDSKPDGV